MVVDREARAEVDWEGVARTEAAVVVVLDRRMDLMGGIDSLKGRNANESAIGEGKERPRREEDA